MSLIKINRIQLWQDTLGGLTLLRGLRQGEDYSVPIFVYAVKSPLDNGTWYDTFGKVELLAKLGLHAEWGRV